MRWAAKKDECVANLRNKFHALQATTGLEAKPLSRMRTRQNKFGKINGGAYPADTASMTNPSRPSNASDAQEPAGTQMS